MECGNSQPSSASCEQSLLYSNGLPSCYLRVSLTGLCPGPCRYRGERGEQKEYRLWSGNRARFKHSSTIYWPSDHGQITLSPRAVMRMKWDYVRKELDTAPATQKGPDIVQSILSRSLLRTPPGPKPSLEPKPSQLWVLNACPNLTEFFLLGPVFISFPPSGCSFQHVSCLPSTH